MSLECLMLCGVFQCAAVPSPSAMKKPAPQEMTKKTCAYFFRMTDAEKGLLLRLAKQDRVSAPALLRHLIREYARIRGGGNGK